MIDFGIRGRLESLYSRYNRYSLIYPDPLHFVYAFRRHADRELAGLIASCMAFGRVCQIRCALESVFRLTGSPAEFLERGDGSAFRDCFSGFRHRYVSGDDLAQLMLALKRTIETWGSLEACFEAGIEPGRETMFHALAGFAGCLRRSMDVKESYLVPDPTRGSASKRLNLFLRWMVRRDSVDPGVWRSLPRRRLIVPLDTHTFRISRALGFTSRKQADLKAALETTAAFRRINRDDPVKYDFALARLGARSTEPDTSARGEYDRLVGRSA
jgi:uncharacterized protein (TIGR02757 family)